MFTRALGRNWPAPFVPLQFDKLKNDSPTNEWRMSEQTKQNQSQQNTHQSSGLCNQRQYKTLTLCGRERDKMRGVCVCEQTNKFSYCKRQTEAA